MPTRRRQFLSIEPINPIKNFGWFGEGDDMIFIDGAEKPTLNGTGTEDYFCAAWGFPGGFTKFSLRRSPSHGD